MKEFSSQMLGPDEVHAKLRASGDVRIYNDPKLNDPKEYGAFISRLHSLGLAEFCLEPQEEEVGLFFCEEETKPPEADHGLPQGESPFCRAIHR